jgi:hypothetical protein
MTYIAKKDRRSLSLLDLVEGMAFDTANANYYRTEYKERVAHPNSTIRGYLGRFSTSDIRDWSDLKKQWGREPGDIRPRALKIFHSGWSFSGLREWGPSDVYSYLKQIIDQNLDEFRMTDQQFGFWCAINREFVLWEKKK